MQFFFLLPLAAITWACSPTTKQNVLPTVSTTEIGRSKRTIKEVVVTVISNENYNEAQNYLHAKVAEAMLEDIANSHGVRYSRNHVIQEIKNRDGKFAVQYNITGADCFSVRNFVSGTKSSTSHFVYASLDCDEEKYLI